MYCYLQLGQPLLVEGISVGNIILQSVINGFGPGVIAGYAAGVKLNNLVITSFTTLGNGVSNYTAQNLGAGKYDRIRAGLRAGTTLVWALSDPIFVLYFFFGPTPETLPEFTPAPAPTAVSIPQLASQPQTFLEKIAAFFEGLFR